MSRRNCIFSGKESNFKLTMANTEDDHQNWAKRIPVSKEYVEETNLIGRALNEHEMKLIELFYEQEVAKIKASNIEAQMAEIRVEMTKEEGLSKLVELSEELRLYDTTHIDDLDIPFVENVDLSEFDEEDCQEWPGQCPKCDTVLENAPGIGPFCPNKICEVRDGPFIYIDEPEELIDPKCLVPLKPANAEVFIVSTPPNKVLTEEPEDVKVEKKIVKKKSLWD